MHAVTAQARRVREHSPQSAQRCIDQQLERSLHYHACHPERIPQRMQELAEEWDIERTLEANAATLSLVSVLSGLLTGRRSYAFAGVITGFLLQHAVQGWCPPLPLFRRRGVRSKDEIIQEWFGLRLLRDGIERLQGLQEADPDQRARTVLEVLSTSHQDEQPQEEEGDGRQRLARRKTEPAGERDEQRVQGGDIAVDPVSVGQRHIDDDI